MDRMYKRVFKALGTVNSISVPAIADNEGVYAAVKRVMDIDDMMSAFKPDSEIYRINESAGMDFVEVSEGTMQLLKRSRYFSEISEGAFDITAAPLVNLWGIGKKSRYIPEEDKIRQAKSLVGYRGMILDEANRRVMLARRGQSVGLGGIAKGYAADEVRRVLREHGIKNALINLGGNIWAMGKRNADEPWRIGVQDPLEPTGNAMGHLLIENETVVTSGSYEQCFFKNGVRFHHILDPRSGRPAATGLLSVTVIGNCSMDMDALTTAVFVLGLTKGMRLLRRLDVRAIFVDTAREVFVTNCLQDSFEFMPVKAVQYNRGEL
jgi:FAD:protein FMN transferase